LAVKSAVDQDMLGQAALQKFVGLGVGVLCVPKIGFG
jgi:hypothetical protein